MNLSNNYCSICNKWVGEKCDLSKPSYNYKGIPLVSCKNVPDNALLSVDLNGKVQEIVMDNTDKINPKHYRAHPSGIECIQITRHMSFNIGNAIKYLWRCDLKNGVEDLKKAAWYIQDEINKREKQNEKPDISIDVNNFNKP